MGALTLRCGRYHGESGGANSHSSSNQTPRYSAAEAITSSWNAGDQRGRAKDCLCGNMLHPTRKRRVSNRDEIDDAPRRIAVVEKRLAAPSHGKGTIAGSWLAGADVR
jgi:hypothetical protein